MKRTRTDDYNAIFHELKKVARNNNLTLKPERLMIDFEATVLKSFNKYFPKAEVKDCLFHLSQSLFKNLTKHGLKEVYLKNTDLQVI